MVSGNWGASGRRIRRRRLPSPSPTPSRCARSSTSTVVPPRFTWIRRAIWPSRTGMASNVSTLPPSPARSTNSSLCATWRALASTSARLASDPPSRSSAPGCSTPRAMALPPGPRPARRRMEQSARAPSTTGTARLPRPKSKPRSSKRNGRGRRKTPRSHPTSTLPRSTRSILMPAYRSTMTITSTSPRTVSAGMAAPTRVASATGTNPRCNVMAPPRDKPPIPSGASGRLSPRAASSLIINIPAAPYTTRRPRLRA